MSGVRQNTFIEAQAASCRSKAGFQFISCDISILNAIWCFTIKRALLAFEGRLGTREGDLPREILCFCSCLCTFKFDNLAVTILAVQYWPYYKIVIGILIV